MHRFIPIYAHWQGGTVAEIPVRHHPRVRGTSKYGLARIYKVLLDLFLIRFLDRYATKPIYIFGAFGFLNFTLTGLAFSYGLYLRIAQDIWFVRTPIPLIMVLTFITGFTSILMGLLAEMIMRTYYESQDKRSYMIQSKLNFD
jgi:dolichol-phosphate mannosyltransferase